MVLKDSYYYVIKTISLKLSLDISIIGIILLFKVSDFRVADEPEYYLARLDCIWFQIPKGPLAENPRGPFD